MQEELDRRLQQRQARETGICQVRRELYTQCFGQYVSRKPRVHTYFTRKHLHRQTDRQIEAVLTRILHPVLGSAAVSPYPIVYVTIDHHCRHWQNIVIMPVPEHLHLGAVRRQRSLKLASHRKKQFVGYVMKYAVVDIKPTRVIDKKA